MFTHPAFKTLTRLWWVLLVRGLVSVLFAVVAFEWPGPALVALVLLYGAYAFVDGMTALWAGAFGGAVWLALSGVLGLGAGILTFINPGITAVALYGLIAAWAVVRGIFEIMAAIKLRKEITGEWALIGGGVLSIAFGMLLLAYPVAGILALVWLIGTYSLAFGAAMIFLAFRLRGLTRKLEMYPGRA
jgi:uncharacterized membrane protein HdeD (DUF308 family)